MSPLQVTQQRTAMSGDSTPDGSPPLLSPRTRGARHSGDSQLDDLPAPDVQRMSSTTSQGGWRGSCHFLYLQEHACVVGASFRYHTGVHEWLRPTLMP